MADPNHNHLHPGLEGSQAGFTLIEIMVVVAIIGVMTALIVGTISRDTDRLAWLEAQRFQAIINEVRDEAILDGKHYFLVVDKGARSFTFEPAIGDFEDAEAGLFRKREFEQGVNLKWEVLEQFKFFNLKPKDEDEEDDEESEEETLPKVLISPLGEITPFRATFRGNKKRYLVQVDDQNQVVRKEKVGGVF